jgi:uncharacterized protein YceH (UPF0502 family)
VPLDDVQARVLASLIEKQLTTPQQYPLTLNALVSACNQTSNRDPVVRYEDYMIEQALDELKDQHLVRFVLPSHGRSAVRYRQVLEENLGLDAEQLALLAVLMLRGPQTVGELRARTERMVQFTDLDQVEHDLNLLASQEEPLVVRQPRQPGQKEERWTQLLAWPTATPVPARALITATDDDAPGDSGGPLRSGGVLLEEVVGQIAELRADVALLRSELEQLRQSLGE